ncbi:hypothetical protein [Serratia sp. FDAARGOS_506]|uniref:hypothetical protein n=1 Tax=Serratia sp. FDAARGOS_506 TaxID=2420306 RepID=UPI000F4E892B|nr:hypothetical protein [Serratia sp. FDAARGOS_506]AYZ33252.1 hypothetical protein EGY12_19940 [Serratia sp. FDAARGOS_506]
MGTGHYLRASNSCWAFSAVSTVHGNNAEAIILSVISNVICSSLPTSTAWQALNLANRRIAGPEIKPGKVVVRGKLVV